MRLALLGATGGIGGHVLARALSEGHDVHVLARRPELLALAAAAPAPVGRQPTAGGLTVTAGDSLDPGASSTCRRSARSSPATRTPAR